MYLDDSELVKKIYETQKCKYNRGDLMILLGGGSLFETGHVENTDRNSYFRVNKFFSILYICINDCLCNSSPLQLSQI